jgi:hypothetical protein
MTTRRNFAASIALGAAMLAVAGAHAGDVAGRGELERLNGVYASDAPEPWYGGWGTRTFTFADGRWSLDFVHALDERMEKRTFRFRTGGPYRIGPASAAVPGAFEADFDETVKLVTLLTDDAGLAARFGFAPCGLVPGQEADVSVSGCASWKPVAVCGTDHDLLALDARGLHFGVRPRDNDMCSPDKRPTALLQPVVRR